MNNMGRSRWLPGENEKNLI